MSRANTEQAPQPDKTQTATLPPALPNICEGSLSHWSATDERTFYDKRKLRW